MFNKLFVDHPSWVNETYGEHWYVANCFGILMLKAGMAAVVHGFIPGLFTRTGSDIVKGLNAEVMNRNPSHRSDERGTEAKGWYLEYEI